MSEKKPCAFCGDACACQRDRYLHGVRWYDCPRCGSYIVDEFLERQLKDDPQKAFMVACLVQEKQLSKERKLYAVLSDDCTPPKEHFSKHQIVYWRVNRLLAEFPKPTELIDRALLNLWRRVRHPMDGIALDPQEAQYILYCPDNDIRLLTYMAEMQLLVKESITRGSINLRITPHGWQRVLDLKTQVPETKQAFVAMWFADQMDAFYKDGMAPAIKDAGFDCKRIDNKEHNNKICDEIVAEIRKSRFVVADFTAGLCRKCGDCEHRSDCPDQVRPRGGVYFEAGFAMGLGIPVIWTVHKDQIKQVHFDTRQYNHIVYDSAEDLKQKLYNRIAATIN